MRIVTVEVSRTIIESTTVVIPIGLDDDLAEVSLDVQDQARQIARDFGDDDWSWQDTKVSTEIVADERNISV